MIVVPKGEVLRVFLKELTEKEIERIIVPKVGENKGKQVQIYKDKTHLVKLQVKYTDMMSNEEKEEWFDCGATKVLPGKPAVWWKKLEEGGEVINPGALVTYQAKENGEWNSRINLLTFALFKNGPEQENPFIFKPEEGQGQPTGPSGGGFKKDMSGIEAGHALNAAFAACGYKMNRDKVLDMAEKIHNLTTFLKKQYKEQNPKISDYDSGATVGAAVLNASRITGDIEVIKTNTELILAEYTPRVLDYVKTGSSVSEPEGLSDKKIKPSETLDDDIPF